MPLDPEAKMLLEQMTTVVRPFDELSVEEARAAIVTLSAAAGEGEDVARVENRTVPGPRALPGARLLPRRRLGDRQPRDARRPLPPPRQCGGRAGRVGRLPPRARASVPRLGR